MSPIVQGKNFVKIAEKPLFHEICAENEIKARNKKHLGFDSSHRIPPRLVTRKFRQKSRKSIISRDICKKRNYASKSKTIWELNLLIKYIPLW